MTDDKLTTDPVCDPYTTPDRRGWMYTHKPPASGDCRKLVWLIEGGMAWVGIRAWHAADERWFNGNEPESARVLAWQDLPKRPTRFWDRGRLVEGGDRD